MKVLPELQKAVLALKTREAIRDPGLFRWSIALLALTTLGFCFHGLLHLQPATVALLGASLFMLIGQFRRKSSKEHDLDYLTEVEWKTIFFFVGLFILVGALVRGGPSGFWRINLFI